MAVLKLTVLKPVVFLFLAALMLPLSANAQTRKETLADVRQELSFLYVEIQNLKREQSTTGAVQPLAGDTEIQRLDSLEGEMQRLTNKVEKLQFRIDRIVKDGTNRIGDLEYRLVELEGGDVSKLKETTTLGGDLAKPVVPAVVTPAPQTGGDLAVAEKGDFDTAKAAFDKGDYQRAADLFATYGQTYPGGSLTAEASYWRGEALAQTGDWSNAARAYLQSFSAAPGSTFAPRALFRLGVSLDKIGQSDEACLTLNEVGVRYPGSDAEAKAKTEMTTLGCSG